MAYRHTQIGWAMIVILGVIIAILAGAAAASGGFASVVVFSVVVLLAVCLVLFISHTVIVDDEHIELRMGPLIRRRIPVAEVESVDRERLPWWAVAYGIRMSVDGKRQLWRVSGSDTVDLRLSGERRLLITTDEPDALAAVIRSAVEASR
jgi:hypothetical protein